MVTLAQDHWDVTNGNFDDCEKTDADCLESFGDANHHRSTKRTLVVSPVRLQTESETNSQRKWLGYSRQLMNTVLLTQSLYNYGHNVRDLHLHRIPFLDHRMLRVILSGHSMPNLASLGVYRCELLHFGHTVDLLAIAERRRDAGHPLRDLDFFPRYHDGPNDRHRDGSYGVTWEDVGVDTPRAIFSHLLYRILPKAEELGFDMINRSTSFRAWLEKVPLPPLSLPRVLDLYLRRRDARRHTLTPQQGSKATFEFHHQLLAAITYPNDNKQTNCADWDRQKVCARCKTKLVKLMFRSPIAPACAGCWLSDYMTERETDHYKLNKHYVISMLLSREHKLPDRIMKDDEYDDLHDQEDDGAGPVPQTTPAPNTSPQITPAQTAPAAPAAPALAASTQNSGPALATIGASAEAKKKTRDEIVFFLDARNVVNADKTGKLDPEHAAPWRHRLDIAWHHASWLEWMRLCNQNRQPFEAPNDIEYFAHNTVMGKNPIMPDGSWERNPPQPPNPNRIMDWSNASPFQKGEGVNYNTMTSWDRLRGRPDATELDKQDIEKQKERNAAATATAATAASRNNQAARGDATSNPRGGRRGRNGGRGGGRGSSQQQPGVGANRQGGSNHGGSALAQIGNNPKTSNPQGSQLTNNVWARGGNHRGGAVRAGNSPQANGARGGDNVISSNRRGSPQQNKGRAVGGSRNDGAARSRAKQDRAPRQNPATESAPFNFPLTREQINLHKIDTGAKIAAHTSFW